MKFLRPSLFFICFQPFFISLAFAAPIHSYNWQGFYVGATAGGVFSNFDTTTSTSAGSLLNLLQANAVNSVGNQRINSSGFLAGIEGGYNWQWNRLLVGLETDIQSLSTNGETNTGAILYPDLPANQFVITSYANNNWMFTARPRIGVITQNWLFYLTGGVGLTVLQSDFIFTNNAGAFESKRVSKVTPGYVIGAGAEAGLTTHTSLKAEYLFANFNSQTAGTKNQNIPAGQTFSNTVQLKSNMLRLGVNYHFDDQSIGASNALQLIPALFNVDQWQSDIGTRLFASTGIDGAPQPLLNGGNMPLISRLTFSHLNAISGETFARADHTSGLFAKGYIGAGSITNGQLNDEDFPAEGAYSNTVSNVLGNLSYATVDAGYSFFNMPFAKTGAFIGYNYYAQNLNVYNCRQTAGSLVCNNPAELNNLLILSEDDKFNSLRIGLVSQFDLTNQLTFTSEAAFLPLVNFRGTDMHNARQLIGPEQSNDGDGAMLESILDYQFAHDWHVGLGARYWMWNMHDGSVTFNFLGGSMGGNQPARFNTNRYGVFLQLNYRDDEKDHADILTTRVNWKGLFIGGHLGGAWGQSRWTDPFGATPGDPGFINAPGYGDQMTSWGPLGGADLKLNWQTNQWVYGLASSLNIADIRGENTLFSGLGGVNGQTIINDISTLVGRLGVAWNRSLFYVNGGRAMLNTQYKLNANTGVLTLGADSQTLNRWGWVGGVGVDYALTDHWVTSVEYDYIHVPHYSVSFPSVAIINQNQIAASQTLNMFNVGVNYKFDL